MVRQVDINSIVGPCTAAFFWNCVYEDAGPTVVYHTRVNKDPAAEVGPWQEGVRQVHFCMPLAAPEFVKRSVGIDAVRVRETQVVLWHNTRSFTVRSSTLVLNVPGAARFQTSLVLNITERTPDGPDEVVCDVAFQVKCSAGMPWPLSGSIESIMADKATESMQAYLAYCQELVDEALSARETQTSESTGTGAEAEAVARASPRVSANGARASGGGEGGDHRERLTSRSMRWPSVAVRSFPQDVEELLSILSEGDGTVGPGEATSPSPGAATGGEGTQGSGFQDAHDNWMSPTTSFSCAASDDGQGAGVSGAAGAPGPSRRPRPSVSLHTVTPAEASAAAITAAIQGLAAAVQALDRKVSFITTRLPTSPTQKSVRGSNTARYQPLPGDPGPRGTGAGAQKRSCWGCVVDCVHTVRWALWVAGWLLALVGLWYLFTLVQAALRKGGTDGSGEALLDSRVPGSLPRAFRAWTADRQPDRHMQTN